MSIPTQMSLTGFIASAPQLTFTGNGAARCCARIGCEPVRNEVDGSSTELDPTFHDMVVFGKTAERAYDRLRKGDRFIASGYIHEYEVTVNGRSTIREEFVARRIGHDLARTTYSVRRREPAVAEPAAQPTEPAVGM